MIIIHEYHLNIIPDIDVITVITIKYYIVSHIAFLFLQYFNCRNLPFHIVIEYLIVHISIVRFFIFHTIFEYIENSKKGMEYINRYFTFWPGGKLKSDTLINSISDVIVSLIGWEFMNMCITHNKLCLVKDLYLGIILYFWLCPKVGILISILLMFFLLFLFSFVSFILFLFSNIQSFLILNFLYRTQILISLF